ncbi:MAG: hypothetical protein FWH40_00080 [Coriobacteriia bacterium]|nr:hypothetical protein [Coriobacteriia bacterium]
MLIWMVALAMLWPMTSVADASISRAQESTVPEQIFRLQVRMPVDWAVFLLPTSSVLDGVEHAKPYSWDVDWGDGSNTLEEGNSSMNGGIAHVYALAGEYTIGISPHSSTEAWLAAFGFHEGNTGSNGLPNKALVLGAPCSLTPQMSRTNSQIDGTEACPSFEWAYLFYGCNNLVETPSTNGWNDIANVGAYFAHSMFRNCTSLATLAEGFDLPANITKAGYFFCYLMFSGCEGLRSLCAGFHLPQQIRLLEDGFACEMFSGCTSLAALPDGFNLPSSLTNVGGLFAAYMFYRCTSLATLPDGFNLPPNITAVGHGFVAQMFMYCTGLTSLPEGFTLPQNIMGENGSFAYRMFFGAGSEAFQFNRDFRFPKGINYSSNDPFYGAICLSSNAPRQIRTATSIIAGCLTPWSECFTFDSHFSDLDYIHANWGGGSKQPPIVGEQGSGDYNGDGLVSVDEVIIALQSSLDASGLHPLQAAALDLDFDGYITMSDVVLALRRTV